MTDDERQILRAIGERHRRELLGIDKILSGAERILMKGVSTAASVPDSDSGDEGSSPSPPTT